MFVSLYILTECKCQGWQAPSCLLKFSLNILFIAHSAHHHLQLKGITSCQMWLQSKNGGSNLRMQWHVPKEPKGGTNLFKQMTFYVIPKISVNTKLHHLYWRWPSSNLHNTNCVYSKREGKLIYVVVSRRWYNCSGVIVSLHKMWVGN